MFDSPEAANLWFDIFNGVLFTGALLVAVGTWGTIKTATLKEKYSDERISANELETKRAVAESDKANAALGMAQADIAKANVKIAEADARAKEAELKLIQLHSKLGSRLIKSTIQERRPDRQRRDNFEPVCHNVLRYGGSPSAC